MITLRPFDRSDLPLLIHWIDTPALLLQWGGPVFSFPLDEEQLATYLQGANQPNSTTLIYSVIESETNAVIGHISLANIDQRNKSARIGKVLVGVQRARGKGIGQQMMTEILRVAFNELYLHRVSLGVFDFNTSAIACYEKAGFQKEGLLRDARKFGDEYWNLWEMSILEHEWKARK